MDLPRPGTDPPSEPSALAMVATVIRPPQPVTRRGPGLYGPGLVVHFPMVVQSLHGPRGRWTCLHEQPLVVPQLGQAWQLPARCICDAALHAHRCVAG